MYMPQTLDKIHNPTYTSSQNVVVLNMCERDYSRL